MSVSARALILTAISCAAATACRPDFQVSRAPGRPKDEVARSIHTPSSYAGQRTTVKVSLGESEHFGFLCPGRVSVLLEDDPAQRISIREGVELEATLVEPTPGETGLCPYLEITANVDSIDPATVTPAFAAQGYEPHIEISGIEVRDDANGPDGVIDKRQARLVLGPCTSPEQVERTCRKLIDSNQLACTGVPGVSKPPGGKLVLKTSRGTPVAEWNGPARVRCDGSDDLYVDTGTEGADRRTYRDTVILTAGPHGKLLAINEVGVENYVKGVVPSEIFPDAPDAALEAQAVVARTIALGGLGNRHPGEPFDLCDGVHCQVYKGASAATAATETAVDATRGLVLMREGQLVDAVYSADCGGITEANETAWSKQSPQAALRPILDQAPSTDPLPDLSVEANLWAYLLAPPASFCARAGKPNQHRWSRSLSGDEIAKSLGPERSVGKVKALKVESRGASGRATALVIEGSERSRRIEGELEIRRALGDLPSSAFGVQVLSSPTGEPAIFVLVGAGHGHGVGLCQMGAIGMAQANASLSDILGHYYGGARASLILP